MVFVVAGAMAFVVRTFIFEPVRVDGASMMYTLEDGEFMIATKYDYWYVPAFYVNERKVHEGVPTMEAVENALKTALAEG